MDKSSFHWLFSYNFNNKLKYGLRIVGSFSSAIKANNKSAWYFLKSFNLEYIVQNIKKKNIDDLADSFMQIFAFIKYIKNK